MLSARTKAVAAIALTAAFLLVSEAASAAPALAVLPPTGDAPERLEGALREEIEALGSHAVQPGDTTRAHVQSARDLGLSCAVDDVACLAKLGILAEVQWVVPSRVRRGDRGALLEVVLIDVQAAVERARVTRALDGPVDDVARAASLLLLAPDKAAGSLVVEVSPSGAALALDDKPLGTAPLPGPIEGLAPGEHTLAVSHHGYREERRTFTVPVAGAATLTVTLDEEAPDNAPGDELSPLVLAGGITAAVGGAVALAAGLGAIPLDLYASDPKNNPDPKREALVLTGQGLVISAVAGGVVLLTGATVAGVGLLE